MKCCAVLVLLLGLAAPLLASDATTTTSTTENALVTNETAVIVTKAPESLTDATTTTTKNNNSLQQQAPPSKLDPPSLHRVPVYEDRKWVPVETISKLASAADAAVPKVELPIPSRCPAITGTEDNNEMPSLLGAADNSARAAQRGCRFFIMTELMDRSSAAYLHASAAEQLNRTLEGCITSCIHAYDNGTTACAACQDGCRKTALVTEAAKKSSTSADTEDYEDSANGEGEHRSFSIIVPLMARGELEMEGGESANGNSADSSMMPRAVLQSMMAMMHSLAERARQSMAAQRDENGGMMDPRGGGISVSRSMSVVMTRDKDGHQKVVVVHQLPRISIHRAEGFGLDQDTDAVRRFEEMLTGGSEDKPEDSNLRERYLGHLANGGHRLHSLEDEATIDGVPMTSESTQAYYYRSRLCYLLPRLFYVTLMILSLYLVFWLCCVASTTIASRNARLARGIAVGENGGGSVAIMTDGKLKKLFLSKTARYYKLNNKTGRSNSTTSLPPPYPGNQQEGVESCAEPLPEKVAIPSADK